MADMGARVRELNSLERLAGGDTVIHRLHPTAKLISALVFIGAAASFGRYDFTRLTPYLFYPFVIMALAELPYRLFFRRLLIALPFCLFAGISNLIFDRDTAIFLGVPVSFGALSLITILLKMYLTVTAALALAGTTRLTELTAALRGLHAPHILVLIFETTYRYIGVLLTEAWSMTTAYKLRSAGRKALEMRHMGSFVGHLLLRGFARAERVYAAMACRGYSLREMPVPRRAWRRGDWVFLAIVCAGSVAFRFIRLW